MDKNLNKYLHSSEGDLDEWEKIALKSIKNSSLEELSSEYDNGLYRKPLYTKEDIKQDTSYSSARGLREENNTNLPWHICSIIDDTSNVNLLNTRVLGELERGASSFELSSFSKDPKKVLNKVDLSIAPIYLRNLKCNENEIKEFVNFLLEWKKINKKDPYAGIDLDPIATDIWNNYFSDSDNNSKDRLKDLISLKEDFQKDLINVNFFHFDGSLWNDIGASLIDEISFLASSLIELLRIYKNNNKLKVSFCYSLSTDFFSNIAKVRASRLVLKNLMNHFEVDLDITHIGRTSSSLFYKESPWINQLRITNAALSGAIAGVDRLLCHPLTSKLGQAPEFVRRLTRNTHIILQEESHIGKIQDPSGGSFYLEKLTEDIAREVWKRIKEIEENKGITNLIQKKNFLNYLEKNRNNEIDKISSGEIKRIGVNTYQDPDPREIKVKPYE